MTLPPWPVLPRCTSGLKLTGLGQLNLLLERYTLWPRLNLLPLLGDYRPINNLWLLPYRAWSSIQSRHLLAFADHWVDDSVFGNRRGRQASDLWLQLLTQIEQAYTSSTGLAGISADIEKCFNCIPRFPALCLAVLVGTPHEVTTAWSGALASMCRHFKVRESFSSGFLTSTGLAEGCGLSVFGMLLVDHLFACWLRFQAPSCALPDLC